MYFAAYQGRIFVYVPRGGPKNALPEEPNLQLKPPPSAGAKLVAGLMDKNLPHCINHMITGFLGPEEIVLACYDDGDIVAYYTKPLAELVITTPSLKDDKLPSAFVNRHGNGREWLIPKPFFHENVRKTAWGLAIHTKSRIIAVSTNLREITVFAFALKDVSSGVKSPFKPWEPINNVETRVRLRHRNWRIVVRLGAEADNVPSICFLETDKGFAEKVCCIDIKGAVWIADIWKPRQPITRIKSLEPAEIKSEESYPSTSRYVY